MQSNSRLVEWDDETFGIYIGDKYYEIEGYSPMNHFLFTAQVIRLNINNFREML